MSNIAVALDDTSSPAIISGIVLFFRKSKNIEKYVIWDDIKHNPNITQIEFMAINTQNFKLKKPKPLIETSTDKIELDIVLHICSFIIRNYEIILKQSHEDIQHTKVSFLRVDIFEKEFRQQKRKLCFYFDNFNGSQKLQIQNENDDDNESISLNKNYRLEYEKLFLE
ncbi:unnamed protein product [Paramecium sonneborni]|uniref:Uncharacterized protein n=1 Tax=Paramecium sonneborni TaxID=65129 RepID=A0A8S1MA37_9CILI|nr:unnamed protein product [Paramecium sonneborni]